MKEKTIVIIGGGVAGLSAGISAQKNGFRSIILEKNNSAGGECTGWDRKGYHIDGCIHWLVGTQEGTPINSLWKSVGALDGVEIFHPESFTVFEHEDGKVVFYRDVQKIRSSWKDLAPEDDCVIDEFCDTLITLHSFEVPTEKPMDLMSLPEKIKLMLSMKDAGMVMKKYGKVPLEAFARRFSHPALREAFGSIMPDGYSVSALMFALATFTRGQASIPMGGSKAFSNRILQRYIALGGKIETSCEVVALDKKKKKVQQVVSKDGKTFTADYVIAACDAKVLFDRLLEGAHPNPAFEKRYANPEDYPLASEILIAIGYEGSMEEKPRSFNIPANGLVINGTPIKRLPMTQHSHEPSWAPKGHTLITCDINQFYNDYEGWNSLYKDRSAYRKEKERIGNKVIETLEKQYPEMKGRLSLLDVATPKTYERYCNAYRGAFMAFMMTVRGKMFEHSGRIRGINNLFLSGQWLQPPGGLPVALITGKDTVMRICKKEKRGFRI